MKELAAKVQQAAHQLRTTEAKTRIAVLKTLAQKLNSETCKIIEENEKDLRNAKDQKLSDALTDRLVLNQSRVQSIAKSVLEVANQEEVLGKIIEEKTSANGLIIQKELVPLGVVAMIFESRPNVVIDSASIAIKSGNALILKGGKEATHSNKILTQLVQESLEENGLSKNCVEQIDSRDEVSELLKLNQYIDVVIPRGGEKLIHYVYENATMPVIAHFKGLCHIYVHKDADLEKAIPIILNAKVQRPGVCNAMECLLLHKDLPKEFKDEVMNELIKNKVELRVSEDLQKLNSNTKLATALDYATEYLDLILSIKTVGSEEQAIEHIQKFGSHHTESILAKDTKAINKFKQAIDCSCLIINASTRFNDGGQLGLGAELGISTSKFHAYGPMGVRELTTARYLVTGSGQVRS